MNEAKEDLTQRHGNASDFNAKDFKLPGNRFHVFGELFILKILQVIRVFCYCRNDGHQVRLTGTIVTDNKHTLVVNHFIHLKLINNGSLKAISHCVRHNIGLHIFTSFISIVSRDKLNNILNRIKTDQF